MPVFLDPTGHTSFGIGVCDRCKMKRHLDELFRDPNYPGLRVCGPNIEDGCRDQFDPWRLPARQTERINLLFVRPDLPLDTGLCGPAYDTTVWINVNNGGILAIAPSGGGYDSGTWILATGLDPEGVVDNARCTN